MAFEKYLLWFLLGTLLLSSVSNAIFLLEPLALKAEGEIELGSVMPGDTLHLIFSKESYDSVSSNYSITSKINEKTIEVFIPFVQAKPNTLHKIDLIFSNKKNPLIFTKTTLLISVKPNLLEIEPATEDKLYAESIYNNPLLFPVKITNKSLASKKIYISTNLSSKELITKQLDIPPLSSKIYQLKVVPLSPKHADFEFSFKTFSYTSKLKASYLSKTSFLSQLNLIKTNFPISSIILLPFYCILSVFG